MHSRTVTEGTAGNGSENESYRYEGVAVEALVHGNDVSIDLGSEYYSPDRVDNLNRLMSQLVPNPENALPQEPGFCIDRAYVRDLLRADQREQVTMFAGLPSHPDIDFMLILAAGTKRDEEGLLNRGEAAEAELPLMERFRVSRLRAGPRQIGGLVRLTKPFDIPPTDDRAGKRKERLMDVRPSLVPNTQSAKAV